jgi:hypothetical protein
MKILKFIKIVFDSVVESRVKVAEARLKYRNID